MARIGIFGAGWVGLVTGLSFADLGHDVVVPPSGRQANAPTFDYFNSKVYYLPGHPAYKAAAQTVANLIGSECMAIYATRTDGSLELLDGIGVTENDTDMANAVVAVPLRRNDRVVGMIAIFRLLPQKPQLDAIDRELFALLETHAPRAMHYAGLRAAYANCV